MPILLINHWFKCTRIESHITFKYIYKTIRHRMLRYSIYKIESLSLSRLLCASACRYFNVDKRLQPFNVFSMVLYVIVACSLDPERLDSPWTSLVDCLSVREINDFVYCSMDYQNHRCNLLNFVNAGHK